MKKTTALILAVCMIFSLSMTLTSCFHKCEFSEEWSRDDTHHWHDCKGKKCEEIADKAEHTWDEGKVTAEEGNEGKCVKVYTCTACSATKTEIYDFSSEWSRDDAYHWHVCTEEGCEEIADKNEHTWDSGKITVKATQESPGTRTYTCAVCEQTKTERVIFTGLSSVEWNAAFDISEFQNFVYTEKIVASASGVTAESETVFKFTEDMAWYKLTSGGQSKEGYAANKAATDEARNELMTAYAEMFTHNNFKYDAETKSYKASNTITIPGGEPTSDVTVKFADGKLSEIKYSLIVIENGVNVRVRSTITFTDYGTVVLEP